jgi:hypothetical protein
VLRAALRAALLAALLIPATAARLAAQDGAAHALRPAVATPWLPMAPAAQRGAVVGGVARLGAGEAEAELGGLFERWWPGTPWPGWSGARLGATAELHGAPRSGMLAAGARIALRRGGVRLQAGPTVVRAGSGGWRAAIAGEGAHAFDTPIGRFTAAVTLWHVAARSAVYHDSLEVRILTPVIGPGFPGGPVTDSMEVVPHRRLVRPAEPARQVADAAASIAADRGRLFAELSAGARVQTGGHRRQLWATLDAGVRLHPRLAVAVTVGSSPAFGALELPSGGVAALSFRITPPGGAEPRRPASSFRAEPRADGARALRVCLPAAKRVELQGDATWWEPMPLTRRDGCWWEIVLRAAAGLHRIALRVDGGPWGAPPGLPAIDDGFGGEVGVLVIE